MRPPVIPGNAPEVSGSPWLDRQVEDDGKPDETDDTEVP